MNATFALIAGCAVVTITIRGVVPLLVGGRPLPERLAGVIILMAPALLTALVVTQALADGSRLQVDAATMGVAAGGLVAWRGGSVLVCILVAATVTAGLRAVT